MTVRAIYGRDAAICCGHPAAAAAGWEALARGGSVADAVLAAATVLTVVLPQAVSIGGDGFFLYHDAATGKTYGLNASGRSPAGARCRPSDRSRSRAWPAVVRNARPGRRLGDAAPALRQAAVDRPVRPGDRICRAGLSGVAGSGRADQGTSRTAGERPRRVRDVSAERRRQGRCDLPPARARRDARADRPGRRDGVLPRRRGGEHRPLRPEPRRCAGGERLRGLQARMGRAAAAALSRSRRLRDAAQFVRPLHAAATGRALGGRLLQARDRLAGAICGPDRGGACRVRGRRPQRGGPGGGRNRPAGSTVGRGAQDAACRFPPPRRTHGAQPRRHDGNRDGRPAGQCRRHRAERVPGVRLGRRGPQVRRADERSHARLHAGEGSSERRRARQASRAYAQPGDHVRQDRRASRAADARRPGPDADADTGAASHDRSRTAAA